MLLFKKRRERETVIVQAMITLYCRSNHSHTGALCSSCEALSAYAEKRLQCCRFAESKPVCKDCPVHCYSVTMREQMREVMRWAGPRMIYKKPCYAIIHMLDSLTAAKPVIESAGKINKK
ncbi:MAG: nitrous oxide-stimulated promoter family protein [Bacteroidota bacterium]